MTTLTIYLLRDGITTPEEAIVGGCSSEEIREGASVYGTLFVKPTRPRVPKWAPLFQRYVARNFLGTVQSSAAAFIISVDDRFFALTFGQGRHLLHPDSFEERFGLIVTLNSIASDALRSVDKRTLIDDQNSRVQTSQAAAALSFGLDIERDLVRGIVGKPTDEALGTRMAGADALTVAAKVEVPGLKRLLRRYLRQFESKDYLGTFPWVDQVRQLIPKGTMARTLDDLLIEKLRVAWAANGIVDDCWLAVPDIVDWSVVHGFKFTQSAREGVSTDLHLPGLVQAHTDQVPTIEFLKKHYALSVNEDEQWVDRWPLYRCLHCEVSLDDKSYVLSAGRWFEVERDFVRTVEDAFNGIPRYAGPLPLYNHTSEDHYNRSVVDEGGGRWCLMDKKMLRVGGIYDKVEFCDVYGQSELVHVKHYGSSSVLGHLFNQGLISGELLRSHKDYVALANAEMPAEHHLPGNADENAASRDVSGFNVVFAIISQSNKPDLHLPFFAKVVLKSVNSRLLDLGFGGVQVCKISCHDDVRVKKLPPAPAPRRRRNRRRAA